MFCIPRALVHRQSSCRDHKSRSVHNLQLFFFACSLYIIQSHTSSIAFQRSFLSSQVQVLQTALLVQAPFDTSVEARQPTVATPPFSTILFHASGFCGSRCFKGNRETRAIRGGLMMRQPNSPVAVHTRNLVAFLHIFIASFHTFLCCGVL
jgi:hypothetical protein